MTFLSTKISFGEMLSGEFARKDNYAQTTTETLKLPFWPTMAKDRGECCAPLIKKPVKTYSGTHLNPFLVSFHFFPIFTHDETLFAKFTKVY